ncbi:MAG: hypothetical protein LBG84_05255 [Treponema sp.]|jgi:TolB-like protein|nr:hypothetical protein [Treponema sp.]
MKKIIGTAVLAAALIGPLWPQEAMTLNDAIAAAAGDIQGRVRRNSKIAVLDISSRSGRVSAYIMEELMAEIVNEGYATVVERDQIELITKELEFQSSAGVSDASAARAGKTLGAQYIITGTFEQSGDNYRLRIKVLETQSAAIRLMFNETVLNDSTISGLMSRRSAPGAVSSTSQRDVLEAAEVEILRYFRKGNPSAAIQGNKVRAEAVYKKQIVKIEITATGGDNFNIDIDSRAKNKDIAQWKVTLRKRIERRLRE